MDERREEQLLYELHGPAAYLRRHWWPPTSQATVARVDRVRLAGVLTTRAPARAEGQRVFDGGWFGEGEISYRRPNAETRAARLAYVDSDAAAPGRLLRMDLVGISSVFGDGNNLCWRKHQWAEPRASPARSPAAPGAAGGGAAAARSDGLWTCGPAGGWRGWQTWRLSAQSCLIARTGLPASFAFID